MSEAVRQLTPVEVVKDRVYGYILDHNLVLDNAMQKGLNEAFECGLKYESEYQSDRFKVSYMNVRAYKEENRLLKTQLRVLTKYIEGLEGGLV